MTTTSHLVAVTVGVIAGIAGAALTTAQPPAAQPPAVELTPRPAPITFPSGHVEDNYDPTATRWAEDSLPQRMYDFVAEHPGANLMPWDDSNTLRGEVHADCWLASASNDGLIMCPDGFVEVLARAVPIPEGEAMIP